MDLNTYLIFLQEFILNENKWKALVKMGRLSEPAVKRILQLTHDADPLYVKQLLKLGKGKQAAEYLAKKGISKSPAEWAAGVEKGSENIIKQYGFGVRDVPHNVKMKELNLKPGEKIKNVWQAHGSTNPHTGKGVVHIPKVENVPEKDKVWHSIVKRHEVDELRVGKQAEKIFGKGSNRFLKGISTKGQHMSDEVLRREKELLYFARQMYPEKVADAVAARISTAEYMPIQFKNKKQISKEAIAKFKKMKQEYFDFVKMAKTRPFEERKEAFLAAMNELKKSGLSKKMIDVTRKRYLSIFKLKSKKGI